MPGNRDPLEKGTGQDAHPHRADFLERTPVIHAVTLQTQQLGKQPQTCCRWLGPQGLGEAPGEATLWRLPGETPLLLLLTGEREARRLNKRKPWGADQPSQPGRVPEEVTP